MTIEQEKNITTREAFLAELPVLLKPSTGKLRVMVALVLLVLLPMTAAMGWVHWKNGDAITLVFTSLLGLLSLFFIWTAFLRHLPPLQISDTGFRLLQKPGTAIIPWKDIEPFGLMQLGLKAFVVYQFNKASGRTRFPGGYTLPAHFDFPPEILVGLLEDCRQHFTDENTHDAVNLVRPAP